MTIHMIFKYALCTEENYAFEIQQPSLFFRGHFVHEWVIKLRRNTFSETSGFFTFVCAKNTRNTNKSFVQKWLYLLCIWRHSHNHYQTWPDQHDTAWPRIKQHYKTSIENQCNSNTHNTLFTRKCTKTHFWTTALHSDWLFHYISCLQQQ